jgi:hypothetical protein
MAQIYDLTVSVKHTDGTQVPFNRSFPYEDTGITQEEQVLFNVPAGSTNLLLNLGPLTTLKHVVLDIGGALTLKLNSTGGTAINFPATGGNFTVYGSDLTALYVTNAGASPVTVRGFVCG